MLVSDLRHFVDMGDDAPVPARRLGEHLADVVRAATAGEVGAAWVSALPCRRMPGHRRCTGRVIISRSEQAAPIRWGCSVCGDEGQISGWEDSPFDMRRRRLALAGEVIEVTVSDEVAAALRGLRLLDPDCERLVFSIRLHDGRLILRADEDELDELVGFVAAEANHETNRRRQQRLDAAFDVLNDAAAALYG